MKQKFSTHWIGSTQVRKQRKYRYNAPLHLRHKFLSAHLSKELKKKYDKRSFPLRKGDEVLVMRGKFTKKKGKITSVDLKNAKVTIEGLQRSKQDGSKVSVKLDPSNLQIVSLNLEDKKRVSALERKKTKSSTESKTKEKENASN
tara:strand:+ start:449 stop:883 length:435 start_codon:yes stop_codon:yes gene_type:complete